MENQLKGYYVMPLRNGIGMDSNMLKTKVIDWALASNLIKCRRDFERETNFLSDQTPLETDLSFEKGCLLEKSLRLKSGICKEDDLVDAVITYGPYNALCFTVGIAKDLCGSSKIQGNNTHATHAELWRNKYKTELKHVSQSFLVGYTLLRASNFLQKPTVSQEISGNWCKTKVKRIELPPEVCSLHVGVKGCLLRGALRLPSVLFALESSLLAAQLRDYIGVPLSAFKVQESLTSGACNSDYCYEHLELLGDSFLALTGVTALYLKHPSMGKDSLASSLHSLVENKQLFQYAEACGLFSYVFAEPFQVRHWIPPGPVPEHLGSGGSRVQMSTSNRQRISYRTLADVVEALVGSYILNGSINDTLKAISWLKIPIEYPSSAAEAVLALSEKYSVKRTLLASIKISELEKRLKYQFRNVALLYVALHNNSEEIEGGLDFSRLAYLGDNILLYLVTKHLILMDQGLSVGDLNEMKQSIINKENLAYSAVKNGLHLFLQGLSSSVRDSVSLYTSMFHRQSQGAKVPSAYGIPGQCAPKILGVEIPALAAAVYLDSELDIKVVWKVLRPLLEPLPTPGCFSLHPITELMQLCEKLHLSCEIQCIYKAGIFEARVISDQVIIASCEHEEKRLARRFAAVKALRLLSMDSFSIHSANEDSSFK